MELHGIIAWFHSSYFYKVRLAAQSRVYTVLAIVINLFCAKGNSTHIYQLLPPHYNFLVNKNICLSHLNLGESATVADSAPMSQHISAPLFAIFTGMPSISELSHIVT